MESCTSAKSVCVCVSVCVRKCDCVFTPGLLCASLFLHVGSILMEKNKRLFVLMQSCPVLCGGGGGVLLLSKVCGLVWVLCTSSTLHRYVLVWGWCMDAGLKRLCVCVYVRACVRACVSVHACVRACVH